MKMYLPHTGDFNWWQKAVENGKIQLNENEIFIKQSLRNRLNLINNHKALTLTIPVEKFDKHTLYKDIKISYSENYFLYFLKTIKTVYGNYPYYYLLQEELLNIYQSKHRFLWDLNLEILHWINGILQFPVIIENSSENENIENEKPGISEKKNESIYELIFKKGPYGIIDLNKIGMLS